MARGTAGAVRIIGGRWRGTRIPVDAKEGLRPSADRVRETLFNWLAAYLPGARCLDLFAGTGALGFEALSRGARACDLIECDAGLVTRLEALKLRLETPAAEIIHADAFEWLKRMPRPYDIIFLDPPFATPVLERAMNCIEKGWATATGVIYVEAPHGKLPKTDSWDTLKQSATRNVSYAILHRSGYTMPRSGE